MSGISAINLTVSFGEDAVFSDLNITIREGESTAILGTSGRGKSTLLRSLAGLPPSPKQGSVLIAGTAPKEMHKRKELWFLFQEPVVFPNRTVAQHLQLAFQLHDRKVSEARLNEVMRTVGLTNAIAKYPHQLSVGMRARLALAMSFCVAPRFLFADEPFSSLDSGYRNTLNIALRTLQLGAKSTVVWITHEIRDAILFADRVLVLAGKPARIECDISFPLIDESSYLAKSTLRALTPDAEKAYEQLMLAIEKDVLVA
ncbi:MAG: ATP-binding cassette domain-containing protein [Pirellulaceae bacterium]|nr:ATP-binding cassette domain-containing protein [Pirellulaceae bacterium]